MSQRRLFELVSASTIRHAFRSIPRNAVQRRFASGEVPKLTGAADNAFNRERMAVKQHAGESAGKRCPIFYRANNTLRPS